ncbi:piezo-type mechanosensitive ion channel component-like [Chironomus tepperi]|uniref:piezo-type mechanosensitive ion channel component-like n=1 Tax=Chironomus tepperi TaxID=113505 RepID=UPI00391F8F94
MLNYLYGLNVTGAELPYNIEGANIEQIGIIKYKNYPGIHLIFKSILAIPFWIIMRQKYDPITSNIYMTADVKENRMTNLVLKPLSKIMSFSLMWIIMLLLFIHAAYEKSQMTVFRIAKMVLFFVFVLIFQLSIKLWKNIMYTYWIVLIFFTKFVLIVTYIYQFDGFLELPYYNAIGLQKYVTSELFIKLMSLSSITILSGIQVNYFHAKFLKYFDSCGIAKAKESKGKEDKTHYIVKKIKELLESSLLFCEIHFMKFVYFGIFLKACCPIQIVNVTIMMILSIGAMFRSEKLRKIFLITVSFISMLFVVGMMLYDLATYFFPEAIVQSDQCLIDDNLDVKFVLKEFIEWFNVDPNNTFYQKICFYFIIIVVLTIHCGLKFRQECNRKKESLPIEVPKTIFRSDNTDVTYFIKFFIDYGYQNFGVELTMLTFLILMFSRLDFISVFYVPFFVVLTFLKRRQLKIFWIITTFFVSFSVVLQSMIIGFFVLFKKCHGFQSRMESTISPTSKTLKNLHENPWILTYDFGLLIVLGCQFSVFSTPKNLKISNLFEYDGTDLFNSVKDLLKNVYFYDTVYDTYITNLLAARGAQIMEEIRIQEITTAIEEENKTLEVIKKKMEVITQLATEKNIRDGNIKRHDIAVRNGDYYMFEEDFLEEVEFMDRKLPQKSLVLYFENEENSKKVSIETENTTEKPKEVVENLLNKSRNLTSKLSKYVLSITYKLHKLSRKHTLIVKALEEERKFLKETLARNSSRDMIYNTLSNTAERSRHTYVLKKIDEKFWKNSNVRLYGVVKPEDVTVKESLCELLYITLTHTDLLIYMLILINQCFYANILSLTMPLLIFFWATLTFPRPKKTFWIILIAYTQSIILLKCVSQFNIIWWDTKHYLVQLLGIDNRNHFVFFDLLLLLALFIHRSVQKMFGIWKTDENEFLAGSYELDMRNAKTNNLIKLIQKDKKEAKRVISDEIKNEVDGSTNKLLDESSSKIVMKVEVRDAEQNQKSTLKEVIKSKKEILKANEDIFNDNLGKLSIMITQGDSTIKLYPIDPADTKKNFKINELVMVEHELVDPVHFYSSVIVLSFKQYFSLLIDFIKFLVPKHHIPRKSVDVYTFCFLCDFMNFFVLLFGFSKFAIQSTDDSKSILNYFEENKVPTSLLFLIIMQFIVIIIDRMLYLRKNMLGKVIFHYITIITIHSWMFFILPVKTNRKFNATSPPILFYIIKFIYFLLSAYQIRCGYPARVLGNFLMRKFNLLHSIGFKIFMAIPFLFELRTLIDWTFTSTSLSFSEWMKVETIFAQVFQVKCIREFAKKSKRGEKKSLVVKIILGGGLTALIIGIIWFPLLLFAYSPSLGQSNVPRTVTLTLRIGTYEPIYKIDVRAEQIIKFNESDWNKLKSLYGKNQMATTFLNDFDENDIMLVQTSVSASGLWQISPPNLKNMIDDLKYNRSVAITARYKINDLGYLKDKEALQKFQYTISSTEERELLIDILEGKSTNTLVIPKLLPKYIHVSSSGKASVVEQLASKSDQKHDGMRDIEISMQSDELGFSWWKVQENCLDDDCKDLLWHIPHHDCYKYLNVYLFTDKLFPSEISSWAAKGLLGFYITVVFFFSRILRSALINSGTVNMIVEELPSPDKILNLCRNIYMVREAKQYSLEEDLVAKLFFLYRSPETLIKWTKYKQS